MTTFSHNILNNTRIFNGNLQTARAVLEYMDLSGSQISGNVPFHHTRNIMLYKFRTIYNDRV